MADHKKPKHRSGHGSSHGPSQAKAKKILKDKTIRGKSITARQRRFFGLIAGGGTPTRVRDVR